MNYYKETINYLENYDNLLIAISNLKERIKLFDENVTTIKAIKYDDMPHGSNIEDTFANRVFEKSKLECELVATEKELKNIIESMMHLKEQNELLHNILVDYYFNKIDVIHLAEKYNYNDKWIYKLRNKGVKILGIQLFGINAI